MADDGWMLAARRGEANEEMELELELELELALALALALELELELEMEREETWGLNAETRRGGTSGVPCAKLNLRLVFGGGALLIPQRRPNSPVDRTGATGGGVRALPGWGSRGGQLDQ